MVIALLTAAGTATRMHQDIPKQFLTVNEKPVIIYTLEAFQKHPNIDAIEVVCLEGWESLLEIETGYYKGPHGEYYKLICDTKGYLNTDRFYVLQQLFGRKDRILVPEFYFRPFRESGNMYPTTKYEKVSFEEVYGQ